jgi:eukaryotic-like serine/threonine-protein kinase
MVADTGRTLERYELVDRIAVGGMAEVFRAKAYGAHGFEKTLAIKRILPELARDREFEQRFIAEAKLAVRLTHANVVQVMDFGRVGESLFIAMEFVDGLDLAAMLKRYRDRGELVPLQAAFQIAIELTRGLDFAHSAGVVHRDVSPSNILLSRAGEVKIADFGIALAVASEARRNQASRRRRIMGKWRYMSPEQTRGESLSTRSDLFSAAAVMFELFTGDKLFPGDEAEQIIDNIHSMDIPPASGRRVGLPPALDEVLARALERDAGDRPARAAEMVRALTEISYQSSVVATSLDVAEAVEKVIDDDAVVTSAKPGDAAGPGKGIDDLIREQLGAGAARPATQRRTAVATEVEPGDATVETEAAEDDDDAADDDEKSRTATILRKGVDSDGLTVWELEPENTIAAVPSAIKHGKRTGSVAALGAGEELPVRSRWLPVILALALGAAGGAGWAIWGRDPGPAPVPAAVVDFTADAGVGDATTTATLYVDSDPRGAEVRIGGDRLADVTPITVQVDVDRPHRVEVWIDGHRRWVDEQVVATAGEITRVSADLEPVTAGLRVTTTPPGATVELNGRRLGQTPFEVTDLEPAAAAELVISKSGFKPVRTTVALETDQVTAVDRTLDSAVREGAIALQIKNSWAEVYHKGRKIGQAPARRIALPVGRQTLRLYNPASGKEKTVTVDVTDGEITFYEFEL